MTIRRRPRRAPKQQAKGWTGQITTADQLDAVITEAKQRGYRSVFLLRGRDLLDLEIRKAISGATKALLVQVDDPALLNAALAWLQNNPGLVIFASHFGALEQLG